MISSFSSFFLSFPSAMFTLSFLCPAITTKSNLLTPQEFGILHRIEAMRLRTDSKILFKVDRTFSIVYPPGIFQDQTFTIPS
jgi:hypothetical protein